MPFDGTDTYLRAFLAGAMNTLRAALPALALASFVGFASGIAAISRHPLVRAASIAYVDAVRNVPLLVQLLLWYFLLTTVLPAADEPLQWGSVYLSNAGLTLPALSEEGWVAPERTVFGVSGGAALTSEWLTLVLGLVFYAGAYMSELVRAGLQSVQIRAMGGGAGPFADAVADLAPRDCSAEPARDRTALREPRGQYHQEFVARHRGGLS